MRRLEVLHLILAWSLTALSVTTVAASDYIIVPGHSVGRVWIGAKRNTVHEVLGKPGETRQRHDGLTEESWLSNNSPTKSKASDFLKILYKGSRVIQIEATSPRFSAWGLSRRSNPHIIRKRFRQMWISVYAYPVEGKWLTRYYYDNARRGITFTVPVRNAKEVATQFESVIVHRRGHKVIPEAGGQMLGSSYPDRKYSDSNK